MKPSELFEGKNSSLYKTFMKTADIHICHKCNKEMKPVKEENGEDSRHTFHCDCQPNNYFLSIG